MDKVRAKALATLPECGIMPEIAKLMPLDAQLDKIQIQKAATPVPVHKTLNEVASAMAVDKPNGVVLEKSSHDDADTNASRIAALHHLSRKLGQEPEANDSSSEEDSSSSGSESEKNTQKVPRKETD